MSCKIQIRTGPQEAQVATCEAQTWWLWLIIQFIPEICFRNQLWRRIQPWLHNKRTEGPTTWENLEELKYTTCLTFLGTIADFKWLKYNYTQYEPYGTPWYFWYHCPTYTQTDIQTNGHTTCPRILISSHSACPTLVILRVDLGATYSSFRRKF